MPFTSLKLRPNLLKGIKKLGFVRPTPIQADAVPPALAGQDGARADCARVDARTSAGRAFRTDPNREGPA